MIRRDPIGIDEWKIEQIRNLRDSGFMVEQISDQVDLEEYVVKEVLRLLDLE